MVGLRFGGLDFQGAARILSRIAKETSSPFIVNFILTVTLVSVQVVKAISFLIGHHFSQIPSSPLGVTLLICRIQSDVRAVSHRDHTFQSFEPRRAVGMKAYKFNVLDFKLLVV